MRLRCMGTCQEGHPSIGDCDHGHGCAAGHVSPARQMRFVTIRHRVGTQVLLIDSACPCLRAFHCRQSRRLVQLMHWQTHIGLMAYVFEYLHYSCGLGSMILRSPDLRNLVQTRLARTLPPALHMNADHAVACVLLA